MSAVIGLDIGDSTSVVAAAKQGGVDVLLNGESKRETPSAVSFTASQRLLGVASAASATTNPLSNVFHLKRLLTRTFRDVSASADHPFPLIEGPHGEILIRVKHRGADRQFSPVQLLGMLMSHLRKLADHALPSPVSDCVIAVPAYFTDAHRRAYLDAAAIAGLRPLRLMQEGAAIALAYGIYRTDGAVGSVMFVDVGHSDTQVSVARFEQGKTTMIAYAFDGDLGGRDFDDVLFRHFSAQFKERYGVDVSENVKASMRLRAACEKAKKVLSANAEAQISVECLMEEIDVNGFIRRDEFEGLSEKLLERIVVTCRKALDDAGLEVDKVHSVELVGSGSRIPAISKRLVELFGREPSRTLNASECIACGCALQGAMLSTLFKARPYEVQDSLPFSVGFLTDKGPGFTKLDCIFPKYQPIPCTKILIFQRNKTFDIEIVYNNIEDLLPGVSQVLSHSTIGPFDVSNDEKAKVKVKVRYDLHGVLHIESASLIYDNNHASTSRNPSDFNPDMDSELCSVESKEVYTAENGQLPTRDCKGFMEGHPKVDNMIKGRLLSRRDLEVAQKYLDGNGMTKVELEEAQLIENELADEDRKIEEAKDKKNELEAYVYETRNKILDRYHNFANETEKQNVTNTLNQIETWLYGDGDDESFDVYNQKMNELGQLVDPIERRFKDEEARARATKELFTCIVELRKIKKSSFPTSFVEEVFNDCQKAENWLRMKGKLQEDVPRNSDPVLWSEEIIEKISELRRRYQQILGSETSSRPVSNVSADRTHKIEED